MLIFFKNVKRNVTSLLAVTTLFVSQVAFAFQTSTYATGTASLINDIFFWLTTILIPATAGLMIGYHAWRKKVADGDGSTITDANKAIKRILIAAVIGETASTLVTLITGYYRT
jgi:H+/Cl- antiporter ClcA